MATMFGRFEIQSEICKSETALIYKALDTKTDQVVALKTQSLEALGEDAQKFVDTLIAEGESTRELVSQNIVPLYGAGEIDGQFCAAMEYIQGNSIATMLARREGFSIWDLLDITRQVCAGLEHAASKGVVHRSLEPAKIMVQWDGMVKILGYGISNMSLIEAESGKGLGRLLPYCSPEQIRGEAIDLRSNVCTLGAILYEMVVGRQAFDATDPVALVGRIENEMPASPSAVNAKIQPALSALIMKALAKDPADRYQSARELLDDLEKCKEKGKKAASDGKKTTAGPNVAVSRASRAAAAGKFAAAAATTGGSATRFSGANSGGNPGSNADSKSGKNSGARPLSDFEVTAPKCQAGGSPVLAAAAVVERESGQQLPRVAVDPLMAEPVAGSSGKSFSDLAEMPPLREPVFAPPFPGPAEPAHSEAQISPRKEERPRIQAREIAEKAIREVATVPARLMLYAMLGAVGLILVVAVAIFFHVRSQDDGSTAAPQPMKAAGSSASGGLAQTQAPLQEGAIPPAVPMAQSQTRLSIRPAEKQGLNSRRRAPVAAPAPAVIPGQALIDSSPQGAQFQVDGKSDPSWVTPFSFADLSPGKHIVSVSKAGYSSDIRSVDIVSGSKASVMVRLSPVNALVVVNSAPPGADIIIDGKPTGRATPAQFAVEKGSHTVLLRKQGYLDETVTADLGPAQNFQYAPALRALGNTEDMRTLGRFNRLFGRGGESAAGMGSIVIRTQPRGAQVAINQQMLDKKSPVSVAVGAGNYIVDITLTGFKPVRKIVSVEKGGKTPIDEVLERQ